MNRKNSKIQVKELLRFLIGGGSAVFVDYITYEVLMFAGWDISSAKAVSYICGAIVGFMINKVWTFESKGFSKIEIVKYIVLYGFSAAVNTGINKAVLLIFNMGILAFLCATGVSTIINFLGQKFFVFVKKRKL